MKGKVIGGLIAAAGLGCLLGATGPSCWHGPACLAVSAAQPYDFVRAVLLVILAGSLVLAARAGLTTLGLRRALRRLPRADRPLKLEHGTVECISSTAPA